MSTEKNKKERRSGIAIMGRLIVLVKPLIPVMCLSILLGTVGYLCAISLTIIASERLTELAFGLPAPSGALHGLLSAPAGRFAAALIVIAVMRGVLHYGEQYCNHYIAFRLLAIVRHKVFAKLRELCPAKLETRDKGNLISILTSDIELLEVFYAHTISPIAIAVITGIVMVVFLGNEAPAAAVIGACGYVTVGVLIPLYIGKKVAKPGMEYRNALGEMNGYVLDSLYGADETIRFGNGEERLRSISERSRALSGKQADMSRGEALQRSLTNACVLGFSILMLVVMLLRFQSGAGSLMQMVAAVTGMMGSFGPAIALSNLANSLNQTLASGERVLSLLEEEPEVRENAEGEEPSFANEKAAAALRDVTFSYGNENILENLSAEVPDGKIFGILGASGSGKSTLLKLLMRFWDTDRGRVEVGGKDVRSLKTAALRSSESYVTQDTWLFHDTIAANISLGRPDATEEEIREAASKASLDEWIQTLPDGYNTKVGELGDTLSGGERQRIGIARAFLHDAPVLLLDEPTSNLDALNEGIILKSLKEEAGRTIVLVSHRKSTLKIADAVVEMESSRKS